MNISTPLSARGPGDRTHRLRTAGAGTLGGPPGGACQNFLRLVERASENFVAHNDTAVDDARRTLLQVRQQFDAVHHEAETKEAQLKKVREAIRAADVMHVLKADDTHQLDQFWQSLEAQHRDAARQLIETQTSRKVYEHMLARIQKEQAILKEKMLTMEGHLTRKRREAQHKAAEGERARSGWVLGARDLEQRTADAEAEREAVRAAREYMEGELDRRKEANKRRADFESWRHEVALEAANEAFNASAGRLRKLYALEKLAGNCLQKITFEQVERSQNTEDGFQKIRDVTGLADVMDIVHKFLNRDVEHEQLKGSVKDAEVRLEALRKEHEAFKGATEGITFDRTGSAPHFGGIYKDVEAAEQCLNQATEEHEACRARLQRSTLQMEHVKRWAARVGQLLASMEEPVKVEGPADVAPFFSKLQVAVERFVHHVAHQISEGRLTRKVLLHSISKDYNEQARLLSNHEFLRLNCRVAPGGDGPGRPTSRQGGVEDDPAASFMEDRERCKKEAEEAALKVQAELQKKRKGG